MARKKEITEWVKNWIENNPAGPIHSAITKPSAPAKPAPSESKKSAPKEKKDEKQKQHEGAGKRSGEKRKAPGEEAWMLSSSRKVTISEFHSKTYIDIREWYDAQGELKPGKKGGRSGKYFNLLNYI